MISPYRMLRSYWSALWWIDPLGKGWMRGVLTVLATAATVTFLFLRWVCFSLCGVFRVNVKEV